jgi:plasmid stabilization system protein ParE
VPAPDPEVHPEALEEAQAGLAWYLERSPSAARRFLAAIDHAVARVAEAPERWPAYVAGTRRFVMLKFPYSVVYKETVSGVVIYAFVHAKRRPGYWKRRLSWSGSDEG